MKTLELNKVWTGDGYGAVDAITLSQIKRTETGALYHRARKSGMTDGYEVFVIKMRHKGDKLPGNMVELEDREVYPSAGSFGKTAWHIMNLDRANEKFDELVRKGAIDDEEDSVKVETIYPSTAFTAGMLAEANELLVRSED